MKKDKYLEKITNVYSDCLAIVKDKSSDYATEEDPFLNFKGVEAFNISTLEKGILTRISDKFIRVCNLIDKEETVMDEKIEDTIVDMINYLAILKVYMDDKKDN